ncbi:exopolysaccharide biosynthesis protein [Jannaschia sp. W003]|uniref:exopolysaccharide biosynthesis protein n=1 Tax=Jannaschia sp. W003 TaxID=2867012 RepID=UPI0021A46745|nr:exopolysaccharide biosynthesis protein [Jannaschia sp. W003]UWQ22853.1 exopolysaccharide biosynthesis protein [Jannaschia sp. W003]
MSGSGPIEEPVDQIEDVATDAERISVGDVLDALGEQGFGPILLVSSLAMLLPVGMLPGMPAVVGLILVLTGWQLLKGGDGVRLPGWISRRTFSAEPVHRSLERAHRWTRKADRLVGPRWTEWARHRYAQWGGAILTMLCGAVMIVLGAVPGLPAALALPVALFGLGLTADNGVLVALAGVLVIPVIALMLWLSPVPLPWVGGG